MSEASVEELEKFLLGNELRFETVEGSKDLLEHSIREIIVVNESERLRVPVFDEFDDADIPSRAVRLHLVLDACVCVEEAVDRDEWRADLGFKDLPIIHRVYARLTEIVPRVRAIVGQEIQPVHSHEIEFNTSVAVKLRASRD